MRSRSDELEAFKSDIDLVRFAENEGYEIDRRRTSRTSVAMKHETRGDRILVAKRPNGHFVYASVHDPADNGTIVDFLQRRGGGSLGEVRKALRPWVGESASVPLQGRLSARGGDRPRQPLEPVSVDLSGVQAAFAATEPIESRNAYLSDARGIPEAVYLDGRFAGRVRSDARGNIVFPHWEARGALTGFEIKNAGFTGFAKGGMKRLFGSDARPGDTHLVVCETGIDALSYAALFGLEGRRFVSTAGALNPSQPPLLRSAMEKLGSGGQVVLAVDADEGGDALAEQLTDVFEGLARGDIRLERHSPPERGQDWNDVLLLRS